MGKGKKERSSNIELLRIFTMMGVILLHYNDGRAFAWVEQGAVNYYLLYVLESICIIAVDLFILISGYYMCSTYKRNFWKVIELIVEVMAINGAKYLFSAVRGNTEISLRGGIGALLPANYFVMLYIALFLLSPYINMVLNCLTEKGLAIFMFCMLSVLSVYPTAVDMLRQVTDNDLYGLSTISRTGSHAGFTLINFILLYCVGAFLRLYPIKHLSQRQKLGAIAVNTVVMTIWADLMPVPEGFGLRSAWSYCNPLVILGAVLMFELFSDMKMRNSKIINGLAKSSFTVYLVHGMFLDKIGIQTMVTKNPVILLLHIVVSVVVLYFVGYIAYFVYEKATRWLWNRIENRIRLQREEWFVKNTEHYVL